MATPPPENDKDQPSAPPAEYRPLLDYDKRQPPTPSAEYRPPPYQPSGPGHMAPPNPQDANQPQPQPSPKTVIQQPATNMQNNRILGPRDGHREWSSGLFSCCDDVGASLWTLYCHSCAVADINARLGENCCVTYCIPGGVAAVRTRVRTLGGIKGSMCKDYLVTECCFPCVLCQLHRELDYMGL